jgi:hypothetical protein
MEGAENCANATLASPAPPRLGGVAAPSSRQIPRDSRPLRMAIAAALLRRYDPCHERHSCVISKAERVLSGLLKSRRRRGAWAAGVTPTALAALLGAALLGAALLAETASAQNPPDDKPAPQAPGSGRSSPLSAPVGHRQPRASDIPPPSSGDNSQATEPRDDINEKLRICRGC